MKCTDEHLEERVYSSEKNYFLVKQAGGLPDPHGNYSMKFMVRPFEDSTEHDIFRWKENFFFYPLQEPSAQEMTKGNRHIQIRS